MQIHLLHFLSLIFCITLTYQGVIHPDLNRPLVITSSFMEQAGSIGTRFEFRFRLVKDYDLNQRACFNPHGALYDEYIGIQFNDLTGALFDLNIAPLKHSCALRNLDSKTDIDISAEFPSLHFLSGPNIETNVAYCRLTNFKSNLNFIPGHQYLLTLVIQNAFTITNSLGSFTLFTSSSNNFGKTIFDYGVFPNVYVPLPYLSSSSTISLSLLTDATIIVNSESDLEIDFSILFNEWFSWRDHVLCIRFPSKYITTDPETQLALANLPGLNLPLPTLPFILIEIPPTNPEYKVISFALEEDYHSFTTNKYKISITKLKTTSFSTEGKTIELFIQYRNTQNMVAYSSFPLVIPSPQITFTAKHPYSTSDETYDIFKGGAWPITFTIRTTTAISGKYFLFKQTNMKPQSRVTFIASTCDFSNFGIIETEFAYLPRCYPKDYSNNPDDNLSSGVFFHNKGVLLPDKDYPVTVWIFFDVCGLEGSQNLFDDTKSKADILFGLFIYDTIAKDEYASQRIKPQYLFKDKIESNPITCLNTYMGKPDTGNYLFDLNDYQTSTTENAAISVLTKEKLMYMEYFDWDIYSFKGAYDNNDLIKNLFTASVKPKYIYSKVVNNLITEDDYILLKAKNKIEFSSELKKLGQFYPMGFGVDLNGKLVAIKGRFFMKMSPQWVKKSSNTECYAGWTFGSGGLLDWRPKMTDYPQKYNWVGNSDTFVTDTTSLFQPLVDSIKDNSLQSAVNEGWDYDVLGYYSKAEWGFGSDELIHKYIQPSSPVETAFGFSDNCHQWKNLKQKITSLYTPIEIILGIKWEGIPGFASRPIRVMRLIKLFPEGGVFNDNTGSSIHSTQAQIVTNHFAYMNENSKSGVCLFEIMSGILDGRFNANSFLIWMFMGSLFESDYETVSATYPVGNLNILSKAYAFPSQHSLSKNNFYTSVSTVTKSDISSPILTIANLYSSYQQNSISSYLFYLGSLLELHLDTLTSSFYAIGSNSLLVPYYCPFYHSNGINKPFSMNVFPSFIGAFANTNSFSDYGVKGIEGFIAKSAVGNKNSFVMLSTKKVISTNPPNSDDPLYHSLRFSPKTDSPLTLSVWNASPNGKNTDDNDNCSGFVWLFSDAVSFNTVDPSPNSPNLKSYGNSRNKRFYAYGKRFTQAFFAAHDNIIPITPTVLTEAPYLIINSRFRLEEQKSKCVLDTKHFCPYDNIAFWCLSSNWDMVNYSTNYVKSQNKFFLNHSQAAMTITPSIQLNEPLYDENDHAFSIKITYSPPVPNPPLESQIRLNIANNLAASCVIGSSDPNQVSYPCSNNPVTGLSICEINESLSEYKVYCYKLNMDNFPKRVVVIDNMTFHLPNNDDNWNDYVDSHMSQLVSPISFTVPSTLRTTTFVPMTYYIMNHTYSSKGIGKIYFKIELQRPAHPKMVIEIDSVMTSLVIPNVNTLCFVSFTEPGKSNDYTKEGEKSIEGCKLNLNSLTKTIQIYFKDVVYYPEKPMRDTIFITLWPVIITPITLKYTIKTTVESVNVIPPVLLSVNPIVPTPQFAPVSLNTLVSVLSQVTKIESNIIGDKSDYTFEFDFISSNIIAEIGIHKVNEISLFIPHIIGESSLDNLICTEDSIVMNCINSDEGIINIKLKDEIILGVRKKIVISSFTNLFKTTDVYYAVTYNVYQNKSRVNIIAGNGIISNKLFAPVQYGPLRFYSVKVPNAVLLPREQSIYTFRFSFDYSNNQIGASIILPLYSKFYLEFPSEYSLFRNRLPSVSIKEYFSDGTDIPSIISSVVIREITLNQNRLIITIDSSTPTRNTFKFWEIILDSIENPINVPIGLYTNFFKVTIITPDNHYYSTSINRMTYANERSNEEDNLHQWNIGNKISMETSDKYLLDIEYKGAKNVFTLQPGRYFKLAFVMNNYSKAKPTSTDVSVNDPVFKTQYSTYSLSSHFGEPYSFYMGTSCSSSEGIYMITPILSNKIDFLSPPQMIITLQNNVKGKINLDPLYTIPFNSQMRIPIYFSEPNFDSLLLKWTKAPLTDISSNLNDIEVKPFSITNESRKLSNVFTTCVISDLTNSILNAQIFQPIAPNNCYEFTIDQISIKQSVDLSIPSLLSTSLIISRQIKVFNRDNDNSLNANELKLVFNFSKSPTYLYCGLTCRTRPHALKSKFEFNNYALFSSIDFTYNSLRSYYFGYYGIFNSDHAMYFTDLIRGNEYKLACYLASTQSNWNSRTSLYSTTVIEDLAIKPSIDYDTQCVTYYYTHNLDVNQKQTYIDYCQTKFSKEGYFSKGCIKCTDKTGLIQPKGFINDDSFFDCSKESCLNQKDLSDIITKLNTFESNNEFTFCATSSRLCSSSPTSTVNTQTIFPQVITETKDNYGISNNLHVSGIEIDASRSYTVYQEKSIQESSIVFNFHTNTTSPTEQIAFEVRSSDGIMNCYWRIQIESETPDIESLILCTSTNSNCGIARINSTKSNITIDSFSEFATVNSTYSIYMACTRPVPSPRYFTRVFIGTFTVANTSFLIYLNYFFISLFILIIFY